VVLLFALSALLVEKDGAVAAEEDAVFEDEF
jgi:hypothetical protein